MLRTAIQFLIDQSIYFFGLPVAWSFLVFGTIGAALFVLQYQHRRTTVVPGVFAVLSLAVVLMHATQPDLTIARLQSLDEVLNRPGGYGKVPLIEPILTRLICPYRTRSLFEELLAVGLVWYSISFFQFGIAGYRKTGTLLGDISLSSLFKGTVGRPKRSRGNELGSADLATAEQLAKWVKPQEESAETRADTILPMLTDVKGSDGIIFKQTKLVIPREDRNKHMLIIAKTGGGKTTSAILPILYNDIMDPLRSTICIDSKPEMWKYFGRLAQKYNPEKNLVLFNPLDTLRTRSWNILDKIEDDTDAKLIANTVIMATDNPNSKADTPFFRNNALAVLNAIMVGLLKDENEELSMPRIHQLIQMGMKGLCDWLERHPEAIRTTRSFVELARSGSQNADTIMSELSMRLSAWDLTAIRATTHMNELNLEDLIAKPTLFIVELRESELEMLRPLANVIVIELLRFLTKRAESFPRSRLPRPVGFVIDEFASALGRLPDIHIKLNTLRSRNVSIVAAIQSIAQIKANYGDDGDSVLAGFTTKILIPNLDVQDAEWASKETGQMTIRFQTASTGSNKKLTEVFASKNDGTQEQVQQRAVLTPDEIGRPVDSIATFFLPRTPVFQAHLIPFYKIPDLYKRFREFEKLPELNPRPEGQISYVEKAAPVAPGAPAAGGAPVAPAPGTPPGTVVGANGLPPGISDTRGWTDEQLRKKLEEDKASTLEWANTTGSARKWWEAFESENLHRLALVVRLAEELVVRKATITEFFLAYVYSNTDNIQANLHYLDYTRLKKEEEKRRREASDKAAAP